MNLHLPADMPLPFSVVATVLVCIAISSAALGYIIWKWR